MEDVISSSEVEFYIETIVPYRLDDIGSKKWIDFHQRLQKLNQQAVIEASMVKEEFVKETFIALKKVEVLIHEAVLIRIWKLKVLPLLLDIEQNPQCTFIAYSVLFHEAICVGLLEVILFHSGGCESLEDSSADILDYAYDSATQLLVIDLEDVKSFETGSAELFRQKNDLSFDIGIRCLTIIRYLAENLDKIALNVASRIFNVHDAPVLLVQILLEKPWLKKGKVYSKGRWMEWDGESLIQAQAQVWLTLRQLLLDPSCSTHYVLTDSRRNQLIKLLPLLQPLLLDQLPPLIELNHWLCRLSVNEQQSPANKPLLLEPLLQIKQGILEQGDKRWKKIAKHQMGVIFPNDKETLSQIAQSLNEAYNTDLLEKFEIKEVESCAVCGNGAIQRCSRCKNKWYCSRKCQVNDWESHKEICSEIVQ